MGRGCKYIYIYCACACVMGVCMHVSLCGNSSKLTFCISQAMRAARLLFIKCIDAFLDRACINHLMGRGMLPCFGGFSLYICVCVFYLYKFIYIYIYILLFNVLSIHSRTLFSTVKLESQPCLSLSSYRPLIAFLGLAPSCSHFYLRHGPSLAYRYPGPCC